MPARPDDPGNPNRDKFKIYLSELYKPCFGGPEAVANQLCALTRRPADEPLLVVHHPFYPDYCTIPAMRRRTRSCKRRPGLFFNFYLGEFSQYLQAGFSERLIVLFSIKYYEPDAVFRTCFRPWNKSLVPSGLNRCPVCPGIRKPDRRQLAKRHFCEQFFQVNTLFSKNNQPVNDFSFFDVQEKLKDQILLFNRKKATYGAG